jgi:PAS domain S-box-containing protein
LDPVNILLVDDRPENLLALEAILGELGETLVRANSGEAALKRILETDFAAVLLDVQMPGLSGFEVAKLIRSRERSRHTPVIFLTAAHADEFPIERAYALGAVDYLVKPLVPVILRAKVAVFVDLYRKSQELRAAERRTVEDVYRPQQELWHTTLASIGDAVIATDLSRRVTFLNPEAERLTGWPRAEAVNRQLDEVFAIHTAGSRDRVPCPVGRVLATGQVVGLANHTILVSRDGTERPIDDSAAPIRGEAGDVYGVVLVFRDVTEKYEAERRFREFANTAPAMLWVTDPDGSCSFLSRGWFEFTGQTPDTGLGYGWLDAVHPDDRAAAGEKFRAANAAREAFTLEHRLRRADGADRWVLDMGRPRWAAGGAFLGYVGSVIDITDRREAEEEVRAAEERFQFIRRSSGVGFWYCDLPFDVLVWDETVKAHFHLPPAAHVTIDTFYARLHRDDREMTRGAIERSINDRTQYDVVYRTVAPETGAVKHVRAIGRTYYAADGTPRRFDGVTLDVTAERARETRQELLVKVADRTRAAARPADILAAVVTSLGEHFAANRCTYADVDEAAGVATARGDYAAGVPSIAGQYPVASFGPAVIADLRAGRTVAVADVAADPRTRDAADAYAAVQCRAYVSVPLVKAGRLVATLNVMDGKPRPWSPEDVDLIEAVAERAWQAVEVAHAQAQLVASEGRLQLAVGIAGMGLFEIDLASDRVTVNEPGRAIYGWDSADTTFARVQSHFHPDDRAEVMRRVEAAFDPAGPGGFEVEQRVVRTDGEVRWIRVRGQAFFAGEGKERAAVRCVGSFLDVTDRRQMEDVLRRQADQLVEEDRRKDLFLALLAHELRNPLAPIRNGLQVIRLSEDRKHRERSQAMMDRQLTHMVRLIDDLLDITRIRQNKMELRRARIDLAAVVESAVETAQPLVQAAKHELTVAVPPDPVLLDADLTRLAQVFSNLLLNAAKYTEPGGKIWLTAAREGGEVVVAVRDTGIGIPAESLKSIFDMFSQVDSSIERTTGGLGIGLALVKGLVEMHGGIVTADSPGRGQGSTFTVRLPVPDDRAAAAQPAAEGRAAAPAGRRILVADDNRDSAETMAMMLALLGHDVRTAHDGLAAVAAAAEFRPDFILMDVGMPRLNGLDATRRIREKPGGQLPVIISLTGWGQESDYLKSIDAGCDGHLVKPVELAELEKMLKTHYRPRG